MPQPIMFTYTDENDNEVEVEIPTRYQVCSRCDGEGKHVHPGIDGNGISQEEFDNDPDFEEAYFNGAYDVGCYTCKGERVEAVPNWDRMARDLRERYEAHLDDEAEYRAMCRMERMMGA
jgi:hypothetical protein